MNNIPPPAEIRQAVERVRQGAMTQAPPAVYSGVFYAEASYLDAALLLATTLDSLLGGVGEVVETPEQEASREALQEAISHIEEGFRFVENPDPIGDDEMVLDYSGYALDARKIARALRSLTLRVKELEAAAPKEYTAETIGGAPEGIYFLKKQWPKFQNWHYGTTHDLESAKYSILNGGSVIAAFGPIPHPGGSK